MTIIYLICRILIAWFIPYLIANSLASVVNTLMAWWHVLMISWLNEWIYKIEVATWFLMLASDMTIQAKGSEDVEMMISSSLQS